MAEGWRIRVRGQVQGVGFRPFIWQLAREMGLRGRVRNDAEGVLIEVAGFATSTLLIVLGLPLFVFLFLAGWDLALLFAQLGNLANHYASAEGPARIAFSRDLQLAFLVLAGGFTLLRLPAFIRRLCTKLEQGMPHD